MFVSLQFWYWEHVIPKPPPVRMAQWDEDNARLRAEHFHKEGLDGGEVPLKTILFNYHYVSHLTHTLQLLLGYHEHF